MRKYYIARCVDLYVKPGGFTRRREEAQRFGSRKEAEKRCPYPWVIEEVRESDHEPCEHP